MTTTYAPSDLNSKPVPAGQGEAVVYDGKVPALAANAATNDVIRFCRIPAGSRLMEVVINVSTAYGAAGTVGKLSLTPIDGSAATDLATGDAVPASVNRKAIVFDPTDVTKDSYLDLVLTNVATGAKGVASAFALAMANGAA